MVKDQNKMTIEQAALDEELAELELEIELKEYALDALYEQRTFMNAILQTLKCGGMTAKEYRKQVTSITDLVCLYAQTLLNKHDPLWKDAYAKKKITKLEWESGTPSDTVIYAFNLLMHLGRCKLYDETTDKLVILLHENETYCSANNMLQKFMAENLREIL